MDIFKKQVSPIIGTIVLVIAIIVSVSAVTVNILISSPAGLSSRVVSKTANKIYYINASSGDDSNNGLTETTAFKNLSKIWGINIASGDTILLKRGEVWHESLPIPASGTPGSPITFGAYGTGDKPKIDGLKNDQTTLTTAIGINDKSYLIIKDLAITRTYKPIVLYNTTNIILDNVSSYGNTGPAGIYLTATGAGKCTNNTIKNSEVYNTTGISSTEVGDGILVYSQYCQSNTILNNNSYNNNEGVSIWMGSNNIISQNTINNNAKSGIRVGNITQSNTTASGNIIEHNIVYANAQNLDDRYGIDLFMAGNNNIIRYNKVYSQRDTYNDPAVPADPPNNGIKYGSGGIRFDGGYDHSYTTGNKIYYNLISGEYTGIDVYNFDNAQIYNNDIYNSTSTSILFSSDKSAKPTANAQIKNNIIQNISSSAYLISASEVSSSVINNNLYYQSGTEKFKWKTQSLTYSQWKVQLSQDNNSIIANPQFIDPANYNFALRTGSPAINEGTSVGLNKDFANTDVPTPQPQASALAKVDIGAYEYPYHSADTNRDYKISLSELNRIIQFYNTKDGYRCQAGTEDGYEPGLGDRSCTLHNSDYNPQDWKISQSELLRLTQFYNSPGYKVQIGTEDGFNPS